MTTTRKIAIGLGVASGALLAAWLLTGSRKEKTKQFISKRAEGLKQSLKKEKVTADESETYYI